MFLHEMAPSSKAYRVFAMAKRKDLSELSRQTHSMGFCAACYNTNHILQAAFPGKPLYKPDTIVLPATATEKDLARNVLIELNHKWEEKYSHSFMEALTEAMPKLDQRENEHKNGKLSLKSMNTTQNRQQ